MSTWLKLFWGRERWDRAALYAIIFYLAVVSGTAPAVAQEHSRRLGFEEPPAWTTSGAWASDGTLILVDALKSKVLRYSVDGTRAELVGTIESPLDGPLAFQKPSIIRPIPSGFLLEDEEAHFVFFDSSLQAIAQVDLLQDATSSIGAIRSAFGWTYYGSSLLTLGDIEKDGEWSSGFLRVDLKAPKKYEIQQPLALNAPARSFYLIGNSYFASIGSQGFFLRMDAVPALYRVGESGTSAQLVRRYAGLGLPGLPDRSTAQGVKRAYDVLETSAIVTGLYASGEYLYLLARQPGWREGWQWGLSKIDPRTGEEVGTLSLPSPGRHLVVIPGDDYWAFVEKGSVRGVGQQQVSSVYLVPSKVVELAKR